MSLPAPVALILIASLTSAAQQPPPAGGAKPSPWASSSDLDILSKESESLRGIRRIGVAVTVSPELADVLGAAALRSTVTFQLREAGLLVVADRELEDPLLSVDVRAVRGTPGSQAAPLIYRVAADVMQLVRLPDDDGSARIMLASTWQASNLGMVPRAELEGLRSTVRDVVAAFVDDHRAANGASAPPSPEPLRLPDLRPAR